MFNHEFELRKKLWEFHEIKSKKAYGQSVDPGGQGPSKVYHKPLLRKVRSQGIENRKNRVINALSFKYREPKIIFIYLGWYSLPRREEGYEKGIPSQLVFLLARPSKVDMDCVFIALRNPCDKLHRKIGSLSL
jgi:hypothetical protein